jgi:hypothetical protein
VAYKKVFHGRLYHLAGQIVLDDGFRLVLLELALDVRRRENSIAVDVDQVNVGFGVAQQRQLLASLSEFSCTKILVNILSR